MTFTDLPMHGDIRIGSRVRYGGLDWIVTGIEVRDYTPVPYLTMKPSKNSSHTAQNILISDVELLP